MTYAEANRILTETRRTKVANNTVLIRNADGSIGVQLHATQVVVLYPDGSFSVFTGGWNTVTTRKRINDFTPVPIGLHNKKGKPFVGFYGGEVEFYEGMTWNALGNRIIRLTPSPEFVATMKAYGLL